MSDDLARRAARSVRPARRHDPRRPVAAVAIWVLGKLFDPTLESYLAALGRIFVDDERLDDHVRQTLIALDNLDAVPALREAAQQPHDLRRVLREYLHT